MSDQDVPSIDGLEVTGVIGAGGQATVYRANQPGHDRTVALKVPHARLDDSARRRFDRERMALGRLSSHPAIVALLDSGYTDDRRPYLLLDYAPGGTLADRLAGDGPLAVEEATELAVSMAGALACAHSAGVLHRDLKPHNIVRSHYGQWKLTDFGIAVVSGSGPATETLQVSLAHAAPESFESTDVSAAADVYSLASTILTALTGSEPFARTEGEATLSTIRRMLFDPIPDLDAHGVPAPLARLLAEALQKSPEDRPSAADFGRRMNGVRTELGLAPLPLVLTAVDPDPGPPPALSPARPTREARITGPFHRIRSKTDTTTPLGRGRRRPSRRTVVLAVLAVIAASVFAGPFVRGPRVVDFVIDTVAMSPAFAADGVDDDGNDGPNDDDNDNDNDNNNNNDGDNDDGGGGRGGRRGGRGPGGGGDGGDGG